MNRRSAAIASLALLAASFVLAVVVAVQRFPRGVTVLACLALALLVAWWAWFTTAPPGRCGMPARSSSARSRWSCSRDACWRRLILAGIGLSLATARRVFTDHAPLRAASPPKRAVLFYNPKSGGGKAERFEVAREAPARGVEPVELHLGDDLATLVRDAVESGRTPWA